MQAPASRMGKCPNDYELRCRRLPNELIWTPVFFENHPTALPTPAFENAHTKTMVPIRPSSRCVLHLRIAARAGGNEKRQTFGRPRMERSGGAGANGKDGCP